MTEQVDAARDLRFPQWARSSTTYASPKPIFHLFNAECRLGYSPAIDPPAHEGARWRYSRTGGAELVGASERMQELYGIQLWPPR